MNAGATTDLVAVTLAFQVLEVGRRERERRKWGSKSEHLLSPSTQGREGGLEADLEEEMLLNYLLFCPRRFHFVGNSALSGGR